MLIRTEKNGDKLGKNKNKKTLKINTYTLQQTIPKSINIFYTDQLQKNNEVWNDYYRRDFYLSLWEEKYWEALFDYSLELATQAGFTIYLESIDESIALRG